MEFSSEAGRSRLLPNGKGNSGVHTCPHHKHRYTRQDETKHICIHLRLHALVPSFAPCSRFALSQQFPVHSLPLMVHSEHEHQDSASLDTAAEYSALHLLCLPISAFSPTLNSPKFPPSLSSSSVSPSFLSNSLQLCRRCSLCSTFTKGLSSDSPSYNT